MGVGHERHGPHGGVLPVGGTFFVFSDYMRPAVRLAALTGCHVIYSWTHDSIGLGEDGPTHQPVEQLASLRAMPGLSVDAAGRRQRDGTGLAARRRGRRARRPRPDPPGHPGAGRDGRTGGRGRAAGRLRPGRQRRAGPRSCSSARGARSSSAWRPPPSLARPGMRARVVSFPSWDRFERADRRLPGRVLPPGVPVLSVEAARPSAGSATRTTPSAWTTSGPPPRARS